MKTTDLTLDLQAYVDGELDAKRRSEIERVLQSDTDAQALVEGLRALGKLVRENEPIRSVPATRAFYWSQIQRRIESAEARDAASASQPPVRSALHWLRWLLPALGVAAVAVVVSIQSPTSGSSGEPADSQTLTFHSDADGVTIAWIN